MNDAVYRLRSPLTGGVIELKDGMQVGRLPECDVVISRGHPSRKHARLSLGVQGLWVEDLGSKNGTFINGQRIASPQRLRGGDRVAFDANEYEVLSPPEATLDTIVREAGDMPTVVRSAQRLGTLPNAKSIPAASEAPQQSPLSVVVPRPQKVRSEKDPFLGSGNADVEATEGRTAVISPQDLLELQKSLRTSSSIANTNISCLIVENGVRAGTIFKLETNRDGKLKKWTIGSDEKEQVVLNDRSVSRKHAQIVNEDRRWKLIDRYSFNGTFVNGAKITVRYLETGDRLRFGAVGCTFRLPNDLRARMNLASESWLAVANRCAVLWSWLTRR